MRINELLLPVTSNRFCLIRAASQAAPTSSEQLALDSEMDGTTQGEIKVEEKRQKEESWAMYTEANPRGAGNTMNRG